MDIRTMNLDCDYRKRVLAFIKPTCFLISIVPLLFILVSLLPVSFANAADLELFWNENTEPDIKGYRIYYGNTTGNYTMIDVGNVTNYIIDGLDNGTYYIALSAYDYNENESALSPEGTVTIQDSSEESDGSDVGYAGDSAFLGGCFIATAAYGSYLDPHVKVLRDFRDNYLLPNSIGRGFVALYYRTSPPLASFIRQHESLRTITRYTLTPIVYGVKYPGLMFLTIGLVLTLYYFRRFMKS